MYQTFNKYHNKRTDYNGRMYDSKKEANHAAQLDMQRLASDPAQKVLKVVPQYRMNLLVNGKKVGAYVADFLVSFADGHKEIQDVKGVKTPIYKLKKKMVEAQYGEKIIEF